MLEKALTGTKRYWAWVFTLVALIAAGFVCWLWQYRTGLSITGMSRDVSWGFYIAQLTFLAGVAASGVMLVLPCYLHDQKVFSPLVIWGEFLAVAAIVSCMLFALADIGQPARVFNILLYPAPSSIVFWELVVLPGYLILNLITGWMMLQAENKRDQPPSWIRILIYISIPFAVCLHTVTAFLYAGLPGRHFWLTAIMAPRFLASAFCSGPSLVILILLILGKSKWIEPDKKALNTLILILTYAMVLNVFFYAMEFFTAFYSNIPGLTETLRYFYVGVQGHCKLTALMWISALFSVMGLILLIIPKIRHNEKTLAIALIIVILGIWIDKGLALVIGGFIPNLVGHITEYWPTLPEICIGLGVYSAGALIATFLFKVVIAVRMEAAGA